METKKKIFIAGASGTLGLPLIRALVSKGYAVTGLTRSPANEKRLEEAGAAAAVADALDAPALENALRTAAPDWVVHSLTAIPKKGPTSYAHMAATNTLRVQGTENLLRAAVAAGAKRIVGESMVFAYGFGDLGDTAKTETDPLQPQETNSDLQVIVDALRSLEGQFLAANRQGLIEAIPLRYGLFYGPDSPSTHSMLELIRKRQFPVPANANGLLPWIQVDDAVQATVAALERGQAGEIYNIVDDCPVSINDWAGYAARLLHAKPPRRVPLGLIGTLMPYVAQFSAARLPVSNARAKQALGWQPQYPTYRDGLRAILAGQQPNA